MTFLAPAPRLPIDPAINLQGGTAFSRVGCTDCHLLKDYVTPAHPANGVPGNFFHDGRASTIVEAIHAHDGQAAASVRASDALGPSDRNAMQTAMMSD